MSHREPPIRKIVKNGRGSYYINIPKEYMHDLKWKERQKLVVKKRGTKLTIEDWPASTRKTKSTRGGSP